MDSYYVIVIVVTLVGFCALAYILLAPIWRFLDREEQVSEQWTKEALARRRREQATHGGDGAASEDGTPPEVETGGDPASEDGRPASSD